LSRRRDACVNVEPVHARHTHHFKESAVLKAMMDHVADGMENALADRSRAPELAPAASSAQYGEVFGASSSITS